MAITPIQGQYINLADIQANDPYVQGSRGWAPSGSFGVESSGTGFRPEGNNGRITDAGGWSWRYADSVAG